MTTNTQRHFHKDYASSRDAFRLAADTAGALCSGKAISARSARGDELSIDTAYLGPREPTRMLVVSSGLHGVEGFAGSAIQHQLLTEQQKTLELVPDMGLLLLHALNPYGFSEIRRVNENNVDLNRDFIQHPEDHPDSPDYHALYDVINPERIDAASEAASRKALLAFAETNGFPRLQEVLTCGQYQWPEGVQFGGVQDEESNRLIRQFAVEETRGAEFVAWIDIHTGLGDFGGFELITDRPPEDPAYLRGRQWFGDAVRTVVNGESTSAAVNGPIEIGLRETISPDVELSFFAAEFGTYDPNRVFWGMRQDNWLEQHGDRDSETGRAIEKETLEVFRPNDPIWMQRVLNGGAQILRKARDGIVDSH